MYLRLTTEPVIVENKDFQTIQIKVIFPFQEKEEDLAKITLLPNLLMYMNKFYETEEKFQRARKEKYILGVNCSKMMVGTSGAFCFNMMVPDTLALGLNMLEEQFAFFEKMIYHPKIINAGFDEFEVEREKRNLRIGISNMKKNLRSYQAVKGLELIDNEGILSRNVLNHSEQIDLITPQNLYQFYLEKISKSTPLVFVMGNVKKEEIIKYVNMYLNKGYPNQITLVKNYNHFLQPIRDKVQLVDEKSHFKDSSISMFYKVSEMSEKDFFYMRLVRDLLTSLSSRLLSKKLRDELELIYSSKVVSYSRFGVFEITAFIHKDKKDIVIEKIKEVLEELKNIEVIRPLLENIKERRRIGLIKSLDNKNGILDDVILQVFEIEKSMYDNYEIIKNIQVEEIACFIDRLKLDTIYFIEEEEDE